MEPNFRADKLDPLCRKNFVAGGHPDSFRYIPRYLTECLTQLTFIQQIPIFTFPNKIEVHMKAETAGEYLCWGVVVKFGDYSFEKIFDYDCSKFSKDCHTLDELLGGLYFVPEDIAESWIKALKNNRRRTWKNDDEILSSDKFQKVFSVALEKGKEENRKTYPFILPDIQDNIEYSRVTATDYFITYKFGVSVSSKKWGNGYTVTEKDSSQGKPIFFASIDDVDIFVKNRQEEWLKTVKNDEVKENSLEKVVSDSENSLEKVEGSDKSSSVETTEEEAIPEVVEAPKEAKTRIPRKKKVIEPIEEKQNNNEPEEKPKRKRTKTVTNEPVEQVESKIVTKPRSKAKTESKPQAEEKPKNKTKDKVKPEPEKKTKSKAKVQADTKPITGHSPKTKAKDTNKNDAKPKTEVKAKAIKKTKEKEVANKPVKPTAKEKVNKKPDKSATKKEK